MEQGQNKASAVVDTNKRYMSSVPGSTFIFADGTKANFVHGHLDVNAEAFPGKFLNQTLKDHPHNGRLRYLVYQEELDQLVKEGNPLIFTQETVRNLQKMDEVKKEVEQSAKSEQSILAGDAALRSSAASLGKQVAERGELNKGDLGGSDSNSSTVDRGLQDVILAPRVGPGAHQDSPAVTAVKARIAANGGKPA